MDFGALLGGLQFHRRAAEALFEFAEFVLGEIVGSVRADAAALLFLETQSPQRDRLTQHDMSPREWRKSNPLSRRNAIRKRKFLYEGFDRAQCGRTHTDSAVTISDASLLASLAAVHTNSPKP